MTKQEFERRARLLQTLAALGFTDTEAAQLRRISSTLQRWAERECNGEIERDDDTGKAYTVNEWTRRRYTPDLETGALNRLAAILNARNSRVPSALTYYHQTDPRGAALYILRPGDVPNGESPSSYYTRGICVY